MKPKIDNLFQSLLMFINRFFLTYFNSLAYKPFDLFNMFVDILKGFYYKTDIRPHTNFFYFKKQDR